MDNVVLREMLVNLDLRVVMEFLVGPALLDRQVRPEPWLRVKRFLDHLDHPDWTEPLVFLV